MGTKFLDEMDYCEYPTIVDYDEDTDDYKVLPDYPLHVTNLKRIFKCVSGYDANIKELEAAFEFSCTLYKRGELESFEEEYFKGVLKDKLISLEHTKTKYGNTILTLKVMK